MGGRAVSIALAAAAAAIAPALAGVTALLTTSTFEPLAWTATAYLVARAVALADRRALLGAGFVAGVAFEAKYGVVFWLAPLLAGLILTSGRRLFALREFWLAAALAVAIAAPNLIWQAAHGWPFLAVTDLHARTIFAGGPIAFETGQIVALNPLLAPLWLLGAAGPFFVSTLRPFRFLSIALSARRRSSSLQAARTIICFQPIRRCSRSARSPVRGCGSGSRGLGSSRPPRCRSRSPRRPCRSSTRRNWPSI